MSKSKEFEEAVFNTLGNMDEESPVSPAFAYAAGVLGSSLSHKTHLSSQDITDACKYIEREHTRKQVERNLTKIVKNLGLGAGH